MAHRGPVITTVVVLGGLLGLMTANSAGGLVTAAKGSPESVAVQSSTAAPPPNSAPTSAPTSAPATAKPVPPPPQFPKQVVYAGKAKGSHLAIAVAVKGDQSAAYLCDGRAVEAWLRGSAKDGRVDLRSKSGKSHLVARLDGKKLTGTVTLSTKDYAFTIAVAPPPAGLYRARNGSTTVGWIVLPDGSQVGIETTGTTSRSAPVLDPARGGAIVDGQSLPAAPVAGDETF